MLHAISPIDGRYANKTIALQEYCSEFALIKYRCIVEVEYLKALKAQGIQAVEALSDEQAEELIIWASNLTLEDAEQVKEIEKTTNHDVKAVEYIIKDKLNEMGLSSMQEMVHFGLTSQDINNTALPMMIRDAMRDVVFPQLLSLLEKIKERAEQYRHHPMLARTHGQPASPTTMGKEWKVFLDRLLVQILQLQDFKFYAKFGGATGAFNAHRVSYPDVDWKSFGDRFIDHLGLIRHTESTQIAHYDDLAELFHLLSRINIILTDFSRDMWTYISMDYFKQKTIAGEVGSSTMPHKVNPIDFENAEGNLGLANALLQHLASKLPVSRLQRDLTDSTVTRAIGVPLAHIMIALKSAQKGISKLELNEDKLSADLDRNWAVVTEAIQTILRREHYPKPYEALKTLSRGKGGINQESITAFIDTLQVSDEIKQELKTITPHNYIGYAGEF